MLTGRIPFTGNTVMELLSDINTNAFDLDTSMCISVDMKDLLKSLLQVNPDLRISWAEFFLHPCLALDTVSVVASVQMTNAEEKLQVNSNEVTDTKLVLEKVQAELEKTKKELKEAQEEVASGEELVAQLHQKMETYYHVMEERKREMERKQSEWEEEKKVWLKQKLMLEEKVEMLKDKILAFAAEKEAQIDAKETEKKLNESKEENAKLKKEIAELENELAAFRLAYVCVHDSPFSFILFVCMC
jgi:hypothetical protein